MKKLLNQILKFGVVGGLAFIIDYGILIFLTEVFHINYLISTTISFIVSVIFNYIMSIFWDAAGLFLRRRSGAHDL